MQNQQDLGVSKNSLRVNKMNPQSCEPHYHIPHKQNPPWEANSYQSHLPVKQTLESNQHPQICSYNILKLFCRHRVPFIPNIKVLYKQVPTVILLLKSQEDRQVKCYSHVKYWLSQNMPPKQGQQEKFPGALFLALPTTETESKPKMVTSRKWLVCFIPIFLIMTFLVPFSEWIRIV